MAQVQCIALLPDFPDPEPMVQKVFESFYEIAGVRDQIAGIEYYLGSILSQLIGEYQALPQSVTELILSHLLHSSTPQSKDPKNRSIPLNVSRGYTISKEICTENIDIMIRHVNQYFSDIFTGFHENEDSLEIGDDELEKTQQLLIEIWKAIPELLSSIVGQLEQELSIECLPLRLMATYSIGKMASSVPSRVNFIRDHHSAFTLWMGRIRDKDPRVRITWTRGAHDIILNRSDQTVKDLVPVFLERLTDSDDHVRQTACLCLADFPVETFVQKFPVNESTGQSLSVLAERIRDKKHNVRSTAFETIGKIFNDAYDNERAYPLFSWIPTSLFETLLLNDKDVNEHLDTTIFTYIFPQNFDDDQRSRRILTVCKSLSPNAWKAFSAISQRQLRLAQVFNSLLSNIKASRSGNDKKGSGNNEKMSGLIQWFTKQFSSEDKMTAVFNQIIESKDKQAYKLLGTCVSQDYDYKTIIKASNEILKRFKNDSMLKILLYRISYLVYNKSIIAPIVAITRNPSDNLHDVAQKVLKDVSTAMPSLLKSQIQDLVSILETAVPATEGNVNTLKAASRLFKEYSDDIPQSKPLFDNLVKIALTGTTAEAKQSVNALQGSQKKEMYFDHLTNDILASLDPEQDVNNRPEHLSTRLATLAQLYSHIPTVLEDSQNVIMQYLVQNILLQEAPEDEQEKTNDWVEDDKVPENCLVRIMAIRVMVNRLRAVAGWGNAKELSKPVFKLLSTIIGNGGDIHPEKPLPLAYKSRLRLDAGIKLLKLAKIDFYNKMIPGEDLNLLVFLVQDSCLPVRDRFAHTLIRYLSTPQSISDRYLPLLFMGALEPNKELSLYTSTWIRSRFQKQQQSDPKTTSGNLIMEKAFSRLLYLIANHQDLFEDDENQEKDIVSATKYILHYLKLVATDKNISVVFYVAQKIKQYHDINEDKSPILYLIADLAQFIILKFVNYKGWTMETWPGSMGLPTDVFKSIKSPQEAEKIAKTPYFPEKYNSQVEENVKSNIRQSRYFDIGGGDDQSNNNPNSNSNSRKKRASKKKVNGESKRAKTSSTKQKQTYKGPVRQSSRNRKQVNYNADEDDEDEDSENDDNESENSEDDE